MTSAPQSASWRTQVGPARTRVMSRTLKRESGMPVVAVAVIRRLILWFEKRHSAKVIAQRSASRQADALRQGAAYQPLPLVRRGGEDALPMPGGEISGAEGAQAAINGVRRKYRVTDRKDTADGETGGFPHSVGRGLFDFAGKTEGGG